MSENELADLEFMANYHDAMARYAKADFDEFFLLADISDPEMRTLGMDFLGSAGAFYLMQMEQQSRRASRGEVLKSLTKTRKASRALAENLYDLLDNRNVIQALAELTPSIRARFSTDKEREKDSFKILDAIFPLSAKGKGFRYEGMAQALMILAQCIDAIEEVKIKKPDVGRSHAMRSWMIIMLMYWVEARHEIPRSGHYDSETASYSSQAIAALTKAAQTLDPEISERLIVQVLGVASASIDESELEGVIILMRCFVALVSSNEARSSPETLRRYLNMPEDAFTQFRNASLVTPEPGRETAIITKEEFYETFKSSGLEKILLQSQVEKDSD
ncbi:MAG: hypothetical protein ACSHW1_15885 [Yoonia sp.]|uniref:hypothetical protein n=1 Tax=Yoonia sp. TaxID=2212373 RepID=UPI003EFA4EA9